MKYKVCVIVNNNILSSQKWVMAIESANQNIERYDVVDITKNNWWEEITKTKYDIFLIQAPGDIELYKRLFDERVLIINNSFNAPIYPSLDEVLIYENKRFHRDWLVSKNIPHPETFVFFDKDEALLFAHKRIEFPLVGKTNIGASGNGIQILENLNELKLYINKVFSTGIKSKKGFKINKGSLFKKINKLFKGVRFIKQRLNDYRESFLDIQYGYLIVQKFIPHSYEWRCVRIGDSFFAHKKMVHGEMASGTLKKGYDHISIDLLNFIKEITDKNALCSVSVDVFEYEGRFLVNEIQCFFGQSDPYQMLVEGKPGRYRFVNNSWVFEEGMFNTNESYDLRLEHALSLIRK